MKFIGSDIKKQVKYLSKKYNIEQIRSKLKIVMPKDKVPSKIVSWKL